MRRLCLWAAVLVVAGGAAACHPDPPGYCEPSNPGSLDVFRYTGPADGRWFAPGVATNWTKDPANNDPQNEPGFKGDPDDYACIPVHKTVRILGGTEGESAHLVAMDAAGKVFLDEGSDGRPNAGLFLEGGSSSYVSRVNELEVLGGRLGGRGKLSVTGTLFWRAHPRSAASMLTRDFDQHGDPFSGTPGRTVIEEGATLLIDTGGVNLLDRRVIENLGTTELLGGGYIAAAGGTLFDNRGRFAIYNDGDYLSGATRGNFYNLGEGQDDEGLDRGILKLGGTGNSIIDANYLASYGPVNGRVVVSSGTLTILDDDAEGASVDPESGATAFEVGGRQVCTGDAPEVVCTDPRPTGTDFLTESVTLPAGTAPGAVTIDEEAVEAGVLGRPIDVVVTGESAEIGNPMTFTFTVDNSKRAGKTKDTVQVEHEIDGLTEPALPNCPSGNTFGCVDRAASQNLNQTGGGFDVRIVIRTPTNARWRLR